MTNCSHSGGYPKKYAEFGKHLYVCYIDFQKAGLADSVDQMHDSVWRAGLWHTMQFLGYNEKIVRMLQALCENTMSAVRVDGGLRDWFETTVGVLQGCILSPLLFNILLEVVMAFALEDEELGVRIAGVRISNLYDLQMTLVCWPRVKLNSSIWSTESARPAPGLDL